MTGILSHLMDPLEAARMQDWKTNERKLLAAEQVKREAADAKARREYALLEGMNEVLREQLADEINMELDHRKKPYTDATRRSYVSDFNRFRAHAREMELPSLPAAPELVSSYLIFNIDRGVKILGRIVAAISAIHVENGFDDPTRDPLVGAALIYAKRVGPEALKGDADE